MAGANAVYVAVGTWSPDSRKFSVVRYDRNGALDRATRGVAASGL